MGGVNGRRVAIVQEWHGGGYGNLEVRPGIGRLEGGWVLLAK